MEFSVLADSYEKLEATRGRLEMMAILSELFKKAKPDEIERIIYLSQGVVAPPFEGIEVGLGEKLVEEAISVATGYSKARVEEVYRKTGDLGKTAEELLSSKQQMSLFSQPLSVQKVFDNFMKMAKTGGAGSQESKIKGLVELLNNSTPKEARYITRFPVGKLRLGVGDPTILDALSAYKAGDKSLREELERAYNLCSDLGLVARTLFVDGIEAIRKFRIKVFNPVRPALAERLPSAEEIIEKIGKCAVERKYDGFRCIGGFTPIYVKGKGIISVRDVKIGDIVLTHKGNFKKIIAKNKRNIDKGERVFRFQTFLGNSFRITEGHKILARIGGKDDWIPVEKVNKDIEVVFPIPKIPRGRKIPDEMELIDSAGYAKKIKLNKRFYRFMGFWIGDGYTNEYHYTERVGLIFNQKSERELCNFYKNIVSEELGIVEISENIHNGAVYLYWRDPPFKNWLSENFRREWRGKMLPEWFSDISRDNFLEFLKGWIEADGHEDAMGRVNIVTKERDLATFAQLIALKFGIPMGVKKFRALGKTYFKMVIPRTNRRVRIEGDRLYIKILKKEVVRPDPRMKVYNLQIEDDESYCTTMVALHNCQIHKQGEKVEIFSRRLERMTQMFPEIVAGVRKQVGAKEAILEGEALAYNEAGGEYYPFQLTMQRKRKYGVKEKAEEYPLKLFAFDVLYADGEDYTQRPYHERRKRLEKLIGTGSVIKLSDMIVTGNPKKLEEFFEESIEKGMEGIIAKDLNAEYVAGARKFAWIKLKRSYKGELADTVDLVVIGYFLGKGAREKFKFGGLLCAVYDEKEDMFKSIAKIGSGFSEEQMKQFEEMLGKIKVDHKLARVDSEIKPNFWVDLKYVVAVAADEITRSPTHTAGKGKDESGYALRFPRMMELREDKSPEEATTVQEIIGMYGMQKRIQLEEV